MFPLASRFYLVGIVVLLILVAGLVASRRANNLPRETAPPSAYEADDERYTWEISDFVTDLEVPWDLAFDSSGNFFVSERPGRVKVFDKTGSILHTVTLAQVASTGESGLTGLALDPEFQTNGRLYLHYSFRQTGVLYNRVSRFLYHDGQLTSEKILLDQLPGGSIHNGGRLRFGPDGKLWVLTGDAARPSLAQDKNSLAGKVLRLNADGTVPADNPTALSPVYSLGHRNPQGLAWHPLTEELLVSEHGQSAHDEVNLIKPGANYGWPLEQECNAQSAELTDPILCSGTETYAPSGLAAYGTGIWRLRHSFFLAGLRGQLLERFAVIEGQITERETIIKSTYGRLRAAVAGPDGSLYVSTSNRDGRGEPQPGDDRILRLKPKLASP